MGALKILEKSVIQANPLIRARKEMNLTEMRLFVLGLQDIKPHIKDGIVHDVDFHETWITHNELLELFGSDNNGNINNLKKQVKKASRSIIEMDYEDGGFEFDTIYRKIKYFPKKGLVIHFSDEMKPYILELVNQAYTRYKVKALFSLSSEYAWRILESLLEKQGYFKQGRKEVYVELTMKELRFRLNVPDGLYEGRMDNFRSRVLDLPIKDINEKTDYFVWYDVLKTGTKVTGFKLWLRLKDGAKAEILANEENVVAIDVPASNVEKTVPQLSTPSTLTAEKLKAEMSAEGMADYAKKKWLKKYGLEDAAASWKLAVEHANARTETKGKGTQRKKYLASCMNKNISVENALTAQNFEEIKKFEQEKIAEKEKHDKELSEGFRKLGISVFGNKSEEKPQPIQAKLSEETKKDVKKKTSRKNKTEKVREENAPKELTEEQVSTIKLFLGCQKNPEESEKILKETYGYTLESFQHKYGTFLKLF